MRKIALVTPLLPTPYDQTRGRFIYETARALSKLTPVRVFLMHQKYPRLPGLSPKNFLYGELGEDYRLDGIDVQCVTYPAFPLLSRVSNGFVAGRILQSHLSTFSPDLVLGYWVYPDGYAAWRAARSLGVPCVVGALGSDIHVQTGLGAALTRMTIGNLDALLTVSENMREAAIRDYRADPAKVHTVVNGYNSDVFHVRDRAEARAQLGIAQDARLIVYVGRLVEAKGLRELISAYRTLLTDDKPLLLALVGDGVMREELATMLAEAGIAAQVRMPGGLPPDLVARWIAASDVLTLPSWSEGYPNVVVEAIACGRPVVATSVGGTHEIIKPANGILIPPRDANALANALKAALVTTWDETAIASSINRSWDDVARETLAVCSTLYA